MKTLLGLLLLSIPAFALPQKFSKQELSAVYVTTGVPRTFVAAGNGADDALAGQKFTPLVLATGITLGAVEVQRIRVEVVVSLNNFPAADLRLRLGYPRSNDAADTQTLKAFGTCNQLAATTTVLRFVFDPSAAAQMGTCSSLSATNDNVVLPDQPGALFFAGASGWGQQPRPGPVGGGNGFGNMPFPWSLGVTFQGNPPAGATVQLQRFALQFDAFCRNVVPNALAPLGGGSQSTNAFAVTCASGFLATSNTMNCLLSGPSAVACTLGGAGGALITWGINSDVARTVPADCPFGTNGVGGAPANPLTCLITTDQLARGIPVNRWLLYDPLLNYAWIPNGVIVTQVALSDMATVALDRDGRVWVWGKTLPTSIGDSSGVNNVPIPEEQRKSGSLLEFPANVVITQIYAGEFYTYGAMAAGGSIWMWGLNTYAQMGQPLSTLWSYTPRQVAVPTGAKIVQLSIVYGVSAIVTNTGEVWMWGGNFYFNNGTSYNAQTMYQQTQTPGSNLLWTNAHLALQNPIPKKVLVVPNSVVQLTMTEYQTVARLRDGALWYWGVQSAAYFFGRLDTTSRMPNGGTNGFFSFAGTNPVGFGNALSPNAFNAANNAGDFIAPQRVAPTLTFKSISSYGGSVAALTVGGAIYTWGYDIYRFDLLWLIPQGTIAANIGNANRRQMGVLGRTFAPANTVNTNILFYVSDTPGQVVVPNNANAVFRLIAQGGSFGLGLLEGGVLYQWGNSFVNNFDVAPNLAAAQRTPQFAAGYTFLDPPLPALNVKTQPVGDVATIIAAGSLHAAALDLKFFQPGCPITKPLMTSQDINFIRGLTNEQRGKFVASMSVVSWCPSENWVNSFINVAVAPAVWAVPMPNNARGVTMQITSWGFGYYVVFSTYTPTGLSVSALGITTQTSRQILFLFAIEQMFPDATLFITNAVTVVVTVTGLEDVVCYDNQFRRGQQLNGNWGIWAYNTAANVPGTVATITVRGPSACAGYGAYSSDSSNEGLLGLLALIALPVLCYLGLYAFLWYKYTQTPHVVEAANPMQPVYLLQPAPMVVPSPAPAAYFSGAPAYVPQSAYLAPPYL